MTQGNISVLIVEDELALADAYVAGLQEIGGLDVEHVRWINDAVSELEASAYGVVVIDVWIGGVLAVEVALAAVRQGASVIFVSGDDAPPKMKSSAPHAALLLKPISIYELHTTILVSVDARTREEE